MNHSQGLRPPGPGQCDTTLDSRGDHKSAPGSGAEDHLYNPRTIHLLQTVRPGRGLRAVQAVHRPGGR